MLSPLTLESLKQADPDRLRSAGFSDAALAADLTLLYAFHYELAKVPEIVSEPMIGQIRYQWWRDVVTEIYEDKPVRAHEVTTPLAALFKKSEMPRFWVDRLIDARERDLDPTPFNNLDAAKDYCAQTSGLLMQMAVAIAASYNATSSLNMDAVALAGQSWGLTGLARSWRFYHGSMLNSLEFEAVCEAANEDYNKAKSSLGAIPVPVIPTISYAALIPKYLKRMTSKHHNPETMMPSYAPPLKTLRLLGVSMTGKI